MSESRSGAGGRLQALLFDLDGTMVDTDPIHLRAWQDVLRPHGYEVDAAQYRARISGRLNPAIVADYLPALSPEDAQAFADQKEAAFRAAATALQPLAGLAELLDRAKVAGLALGMVTNAPAPNTRHLLSLLGLQGVFDVEVLGGELPAGKPDPLPYREALRLLGVSASDAFAFEDSISGVRSALGAGLAVAGLATTHPPSELAAAGADPVVRDFTDSALLGALDL